MLAVYAFCKTRDRRCAVGTFGDWKPVAHVLTDSRTKKKMDHTLELVPGSGNVAYTSAVPAGDRVPSDPGAGGAGPAHLRVARDPAPRRGSPGARSKAGALMVNAVFKRYMLNSDQISTGSWRGDLDFLFS